MYCIYTDSKCLLGRFCVASSLVNNIVFLIYFVAYILIPVAHEWCSCSDVMVTPLVVTVGWANTVNQKIILVYCWDHKCGSHVWEWIVLGHSSYLYLTAAIDLLEVENEYRIYWDKLSSFYCDWTRCCIVHDELIFPGSS